MAEKYKIKLLKALDSILGRLLIFCLPTPSVKDSPVPPSSFLFIRPGGIGDAVLLIPAIKALKAEIPHATISVLAEKRNGAIFQLCPAVDVVFCYDRAGDFWQVFRKCYDVVIDTEQWHRLSAVVSRLIKSGRKVGFATNERAKLLTVPVKYSHDDYEVISFMRLLTPFVSSRNDPPPFLTIPSDIKTAAEILPDGVAKYIALFPGASIAERRWGYEKFAQLANQLLTAGYTVVVMGGEPDIDAGRAICDVAAKAIDLTGKTTLLETAAMIKDAELLITGDSGLLHIAVGLDTATVALFGPGIAEKWAPRNENHVVINHRLSCSPCTLFGNTPPCPIGAKCIEEITVAEVFAAVQLLIKKQV